MVRDPSDAKHGRSRRRSRSRSPNRQHIDATSEISSKHPRGDDRSASMMDYPCKRRHWFAKDYNPIQIGSIDGTDTIAHDKALLRAGKATFDTSQDPQIQGNPYTTLFVGRLHYDTTESTLRSYFEQFGRIHRLRLVRDIVTQKSKGYAFIEYEREQDFIRAYHEAHRQEIDGRIILVDYERSRVMQGWKPRRLGGGLGGRKESGQLRFGGRDRPFRPPLQ